MNLRLTESDFSQLLAWLSRRLNGICDADSGTLAQYVVALLKNDKQRDLRGHCIEQLEGHNYNY